MSAWSVFLVCAAVWLVNAVVVGRLDDEEALPARILGAVCTLAGLAAIVSVVIALATTHAQEGPAAPATTPTDQPEPDCNDHGLPSLC